jgi:hypothetical protein
MYLVYDTIRHSVVRISSPPADNLEVLTSTQKHFRGPLGAPGHAVGDPCCRPTFVEFKFALMLVLPKGEVGTIS